MGGKRKRRPFQPRDGKGKAGRRFSQPTGLRSGQPQKRGYLAAPACFIFARPRALGAEAEEATAAAGALPDAGAGEEPELQPGAGRRGEPTGVAKIQDGEARRRIRFAAGGGGGGGGRGWEGQSELTWPLLRPPSLPGENLRVETLAQTPATYTK